MSDPRSPADFYEIAELLLRTDSEEPTVAEQDQMSAAYAESITQMKEIIDDPDIPLRDTGKRLYGAHYLAWALALDAAKVARTRIYCEHWMDESPRPLLVELTDGFATCTECGPPPGVTPGDDGRCDVCDQPAKDFWPFMGVVINVTYMGNICDECHDWAHQHG